MTAQIIMNLASILLDESDSLRTVINSSSSNTVNYLQLIASLLAGGFVSALLTLIIFPTIQGKVDSFMVDKLGSFSFRKKRKLTGKWNHQWHHKSTSYPNPSPASDIEIKHYRNLIKAKYQVTDNSGYSRTYRMSGKVDRDYITGIWEDEETGSTYHGAFQLKILPNANKMEGTWVGWSRTGATQSGLWEWQRTSIRV
jgi:hypothetical protein